MLIQPFAVFVAIANRCIAVSRRWRCSATAWLTARCSDVSLSSAHDECWASADHRVAAWNVRPAAGGLLTAGAAADVQLGGTEWTSCAGVFSFLSSFSKITAFTISSEVKSSEIFSIWFTTYHFTLFFKKKVWKWWESRRPAPMWVMCNRLCCLQEIWGRNITFQMPQISQTVISYKHVSFDLTLTPQGSVSKTFLTLTGKSTFINKGWISLSIELFCTPAPSIV